MGRARRRRKAPRPLRHDRDRLVKALAAARCCWREPRAPTSCRRRRIPSRSRSTTAGNVDTRELMSGRDGWGAFGFVVETRTIDLPAGPSTVQFRGVASPSCRKARRIEGLPAAGGSAISTTTCSRPDRCSSIRWARRCNSCAPTARRARRAPRPRSCAQLGRRRAGHRRQARGAALRRTAGAAVFDEIPARPDRHADAVGADVGSRRRPLYGPACLYRQ